MIRGKKISSKELSKKLANYGIASRPFFWPISEQDIFKKMKLFNNEKYPNSSYLSKYGIYLPSYFDLKNNEIKYISSIVNKILK